MDSRHESCHIEAYNMYEWNHDEWMGKWIRVKEEQEREMTEILTLFWHLFQILSHSPTWVLSDFGLSTNSYPVMPCRKPIQELKTHMVWRFLICLNGYWPFSASEQLEDHTPAFFFDLSISNVKSLSVSKDGRHFVVAGAKEWKVFFFLSFFLLLSNIFLFSISWNYC